jgi:NADPH-dependent ferric siderophore reductase
VRPAGAAPTAASDVAAAPAVAAVVELVTTLVGMAVEVDDEPDDVAVVSVVDAAEVSDVFELAGYPICQYVLLPHAESRTHSCGRRLRGR